MMKKLSSCRYIDQTTPQEQSKNLPLFRRPFESPDAEDAELKDKKFQSLSFLLGVNRDMLHIATKSVMVAKSCLHVSKLRIHCRWSILRKSICADNYRRKKYAYKAVKVCLRSKDAFVITCVANLMEVKVLYVQQDLRYEISSYWRLNV
jgi:hypothetical protein